MHALHGSRSQNVPTGLICSTGMRSFDRFVHTLSYLAKLDTAQDLTIYDMQSWTICSLTVVHPICSVKICVVSLQNHQDM